MKINKYTYIGFIAASFTLVGNTYSNEIISKVTLPNDGLVYIISGKNEAFIPNDTYKGRDSGAFTAEPEKFDEFSITLLDKNNVIVTDKSTLEKISDKLNFNNKISTTSYDKCSQVKFAVKDDTIKLITLPENLSTMLSCSFTTKNLNPHWKLKQKNEIEFMLKFNYPFKTWENESLKKPDLNTKLISNLSKIDENESYIKLEGDGLYDILDLSPVYKLNIFPHLTKLEIKGYKTYNQISNSFTFFEATNLKEIIFNVNSISELPSFAFQNFSNLEKASFENNKIKEIKPNAFNGLSNLKELNLDNNYDIDRNLFHSIKFGTDSFKGLNNLKILTLSNCSINEIKDFTFSELSNLKNLNLSNNFIESLNPNSFSELKSLTELNLNSNRLKTINIDSYSSYFDTLKELKKLYLTNNQISSPIYFGNLPKLRVLNLDQNKIRSINENSFSELPELEELNLSKNEINDITDGAFNSNNQLVKIKLSENKIKNVPKINSSYIQEINLCNNLITEIKDGNFIYLSNLDNIDLSSNKISNIYNNSFAYQKNLQTLSLSNNELKEVSMYVFSRLSNLKTLFLDKNHIEAINNDNFYYLTNLNYLSLSDNPITSITPISFRGLKNLHELWFVNNKLTQLPNNVFDKYNLPNIKYINLSYGHFDEDKKQDQNHAFGENINAFRTLHN